MFGISYLPPNPPTKTNQILRNPPMPVSTPSEPLSALAALNGEIVVANDYAARPDTSPEAVAMGMNSIVVMPVNGAGNCLGVMNVVSKTANHFGDCQPLWSGPT